MGMERIEAIAIFLKDVKQAYIKDQQEKNIRASGRSAQSIREEATIAAGRLFGSSYFHFQRVGRRPGNFPPIESIKQWLIDKNLDLNPFAVARKIAKKGTDIFMKRRPGLSIEDRILEPRKALARNIATISRGKIIADLKKKLGIS